MRIRTIKPEFWTNERLATLPEFTRLLAIGLLNYADDEGYFNANTAMIRGALFPFLDSSKTLPGAIQQLEKLDYIRIRESQDGRKYGWVVCFTKHQRVDKPKPSSISELCDFQDESKIILGVIQDSSCLEGKGREQGNGSGIPAGSNAVDFISAIKTNPAYQGIDIDRELAKMDAWLMTPQGKGRKKSHKFILNWLNRAESSLPIGGVQTQPIRDRQ